MDPVNKFVEEYAAQIIVGSIVATLAVVTTTYVWASKKATKAYTESFATLMTPDEDDSVKA